MRARAIRAIRIWRRFGGMVGQGGGDKSGRVSTVGAERKGAAIDAISLERAVLHICGCYDHTRGTPLLLSVLALSVGLPTAAQANQSAGTPDCLVYFTDQQDYKLRVIYPKGVRSPFLPIFLILLLLVVVPFGLLDGFRNGRSR
jgi:hypothetical protein